MSFTTHKSVIHCHLYPHIHTHKQFQSREHPAPIPCTARAEAHHSFAVLGDTGGARSTNCRRFQRNWVSGLGSINKFAHSAIAMPTHCKGRPM